LAGFVVRVLSEDDRPDGGEWRHPQGRKDVLGWRVDLELVALAKARAAVGCRTRIGSLIRALVGLYLGALSSEQLVSPPNALLTLLLVLIGLIAGGWLGGWLVLRSMASVVEGEPE